MHFVMRFQIFVSVIFIAFIPFLGCSHNENRKDTSIEARDLSWAVPVSAEGLPNLHKVSDDLYRSAQPEEHGMTSAKALGIKTVLCLRETELDRDLNAKEETHLKTVHVPIITWNLRTKDIIKALRVIHESPKPILVHCRHGADRTGMIVAFYRIIYEGWSKEKAKDELVNGGYGYHSVFSNILRVIDDADIEAIRLEISRVENDEVSNESAPSATAPSP